MKKNTKHCFTKSIKFKLIIALLICIAFGAFYNFVISPSTDIDQNQIVEEEQHKATLDTLDIVGDYLWKGKRLKDKIDDNSSKSSNRKTKAANKTKKHSENKKDVEEKIDLPKIVLPESPKPIEPEDKNNNTSDNAVR